MTYCLFINDVFFDSTRNNAEAFAWMQSWEELGYKAGLKFVRDNDTEILQWLIPPEALEKVKRVAA
ncbi:MAG: hypothetical protein CL885_04515 [Dehalococcoidia bacterium]|nr:hypothetical protein [Dehalococcoidia bacterium]|tara:strand:- start:242 stop:439 length:198 start_codon:yes stop_codon:yes gene_type:complete